MAETGGVFDVAVPEQPRTPEQVMRPDPGSRKRRRGRRTAGTPATSPPAAT